MTVTVIKKLFSFLSYPNITNKHGFDTCNWTNK